MAVNACRIWLGIKKEIEHLKDLGVDALIILHSIARNKMR
jgi:hypothetical protein